MKTITSLSQLQKELSQARRHKKTIGFVPTMGAFHDGHRSLMRRCRRENDLVVVSIFVNPAQFGPNEDFTAYPRQKKKDCLLAKKENVDIIFHPSVKMLYPSGYLTYVNVEVITQVLCGASRPGHFRGVATVVAKLLNIVRPDVAYFGRKDAQQCLVIQQMVRDLNIPVRVKICSTMREKDGLAMSSRNQYLSSQERREAVVLYQSLVSAKARIAAGERKTSRIIQFLGREITAKSSGKIDYVDCRGIPGLERLTVLKGKVLIALAVHFGKTRLIDNIIVSVGY